MFNLPSLFRRKAPVQHAITPVVAHTPQELLTAIQAAPATGVIATIPEEGPKVSSSSTGNFTVYR